ncbi:MAG: response regulator transcription factor, partial [Actinomycetota bacterium]
MRLLICDDHALLVEALSLALTAKGHVVAATASNPDDAVEAAREHQPDACLLDLHFPQANGISAIGRIHGVSIHTKVVILSGSISRAVVADAIAQGAHGFIGKS